MQNIVVGIVNKENKILMIKRVKEEGNLVWSFPGGKVEEKESKEEACIREIYEETGLIVQVLKELGERIHPDTQVYITYYLCEYLDGEIKISDKNEIAEVTFKSKKELSKDIKTDIFQPVKKYIFKTIK